MSENASWDDYNSTDTADDDPAAEVSPSTSPLAYAADGFDADGQGWESEADSWASSAQTDAANGYGQYVAGDLQEAQTDEGIASSDYSSAAADGQSAVEAGPISPPTSESDVDDGSSDAGESDVATVSS